MRLLTTLPVRRQGTYSTIGILLTLHFLCEDQRDLL